MHPMLPDGTVLNGPAKGRVFELRQDHLVLPDRGREDFSIWRAFPRKPRWWEFWLRRKYADDMREVMQREERTITYKKVIWQDAPTYRVDERGAGHEPVRAAGRRRYFWLLGSPPNEELDEMVRRLLQEEHGWFRSMHGAI